MKGELVRVRTGDNVFLHGFVSQPQIGPQIKLDAAICIHGLGGNFYSSRLNLSLGKALSELGLAVAQINTRGHDDLNQTTRNGRSTHIGAAYEIVDECRFDIEAWVDYLVSKGHQRIALVGHSLGAIKSIYSQAVQPAASVRAIVAISASRLSFERFLQPPAREKFLKIFEQAERWVEQDQHDHLMQVDFPFPTFMSAGAYRDKYGPEDRYNWLNYADKICVPTWLAFGEIELKENAAFIGILDDIRNLGLSNRDLFEITTIEDANHFYAAKQEELAAEMIDWIRRRFSLD